MNLVSNLSDPWCTGLSLRFESQGFYEWYREEFFPEFVEEAEKLRKIKARTNQVKKSVYNQIESDEIFDHKAIDRAESMQAN